MKRILFVALFAVSINASAGVDVCREGPHAIRSFVIARDGGTPIETVLDSLKIQSAADPQWELKGFYQDMARKVYQFPQWDADHLIDTFFQTCFIRSVPPTLSIP